MPKFNMYRDDKIHVVKGMCKTCVYRPDSPVFKASVPETVVAPLFVRVTPAAIVVAPKPIVPLNACDAVV